MPSPSFLELTAAFCLLGGVVHVLFAGSIRRTAVRAAEGSPGHALLMLLSEAEVAFMLWAAVFLFAMAFSAGGGETVAFIDRLNLTEPVYVFVVLIVSAVRPVVSACDAAIRTVSSLLPLPERAAFVVAALTVGPLLGSLVTEPAAMAITAVLLERRVFRDVRVSDRTRYGLLGVLFVNVSIGGTLTSFAAPPVVMVARTFGWDTAHVFSTLGWKALVAVVVNASAAGVLFVRDLRPAYAGENSDLERHSPAWLIVVHAGLIGLVVCWAHHPKLVLAVLVIFVGVATVTREYHDPLHLRHGLMVGGFLAGLVVLGTHLGWWIRPAVAALGEIGLYYAATAMTAITDNAALTYLGSQVPLTDGMRYALVAGSVTGGGLTVIANAPNPAGAAILQPTFKEHRISPLWLFLAAAGPTAVAVVCFRLLPSL